MEWKSSNKLKDGQSVQCISNVAPLEGFVAPVFSLEMLEALFGDAGKGRRIRSWGKEDDFSPHFLATRSGTPMHTDPRYPRYTWHLILHNGGYRIRGLADIEVAPLTPSTMYLLDTHSPHEVTIDQRLPQINHYKVQMAIDSKTPISREIAAERMLDYVKNQDIFEMMMRLK
jgi:hypothetical protein